MYWTTIVRLEPPRHVHVKLAWGHPNMQMKLGETWKCMNPQCGCEVIVSRTGDFVGSSDPLCYCDSVMKNTDIPPMGKERAPVASDGPPLMMFRSLLRGRIEPN